MLQIIMECVSWVREDFLWEGRKTTFWKQIMTLMYPACPLQWGLQWFSSPSRLKRKFANNGTKVEKYRETVNMAIEITFNVPF